MTKQELIIGKIQKCCDDAIDCDDNCMFLAKNTTSVFPRSRAW